VEAKRQMQSGGIKINFEKLDGFKVDDRAPLLQPCDLLFEKYLVI
jgi:hypothetical protein